MSKKNKNTSQNGPAPPKRPLSCYLRWTCDNREAVKKKNPGIIQKDLISLLAEEWKKLNPKEKKKYEEIYVNEKAKFEEEMKKYVDKYGPVKGKKKKTLENSQKKGKKTKKHHSSDEEEDDD